MTKKTDEFGQDKIVIYRSKGGHTEIEVKLEEDTLWLTQSQIAILFGTQRPAITKHLHNIFECGELDKKAVCSILEHTAADGKKYKTQFYNMDMIISIGYRVNSKRATQFRIWATKILKDYLVQGYSLNQKRLQDQTAKFTALQEAINFMKAKSTYPELYGKTEEILSLLNDYSKSLTLLNQYDERAIPLVKGKKPKYTLSYEECRDLIRQVKSKLVEKNEAGELFGQEVENKFKGTLGAIYQTFDKEELYPSIEEKAANLLYLTIKDHPFTDGNKRIGSLLFLHFLEDIGGGATHLTKGVTVSEKYKLLDSRFHGDKFTGMTETRNSGWLIVLYVEELRCMKVK